MQCKISTWKTYRKSINKIYTSHDSGGKGWSKMTVKPTLMADGFKMEISNDIDGDERKPLQILKEDFNHIIEKSKEIVYYVAEGTGHYAGFFKYLDIYYKEK